MDKPSQSSHKPVEPLLIVISGPSGVGKDSVIERMKERDLPIHFVVTATTRPPRPGERNGVNYFFLSQDEFEKMIAENKLLEHALVYDEYKGIPREQVQNALASGKDVVMRVDVQGAATVKELCPEAVLIFLTTQDEKELLSRLTRRAAENSEDVELRIATANEELKRIAEYDYVVVNKEDRLDETVDTIIAIIRAEHARTQHRKVRL